ncbi:glycolate oxidase subunit GlcE [Sphingomonas humi]|uniref:FAD-binding protein n=1 Tax=Sphingomonas humi TaxID=335630 RepID=A0ABP7S401_9SPHN
MAGLVRPDSVDALCGVIRDAGESGSKLRLRGGGSKDPIGAPTPDAVTVDMTAFAGVIDYDPPELVLTVGAGTPLADVLALVAGQRQMLAFDPFDHGPILGTQAQATIGGVIAAGVSGPSRLSRGAVRDHLLGFTAVSGRGERFVAGAKVVKNVTGFDLPKLLAGSWGRIAALTEVTLKVLPAPEVRRTLVVRGLDTASAVAAMSRALGSPAEVSAAAHLPEGLGGPLTLLRLDGFAPSVEARAKLLGTLITGLEEREDEPDPWAGIATADPLPRDLPLWRLAVPASKAPALIERLAGQWLCDWGGALVWLASDAAPSVIRAVAEEVGGHAMLVRADGEMRAGTPALHPQPGGIVRLEERVRRAFDPSGVFETGRF